MAQTAEVVIIGGGIIGASIAYHLRQDGLSGRLLVIERDTTYSHATTPMSMGGVRQQYGSPAISHWHGTACSSTSSSTNSWSGVGATTGAFPSMWLPLPL